MKILKGRKRDFFISLISTSLILILLSGFIIVEKNTRHIAFGDCTPFMQYEINSKKLEYFSIHFMGNNYNIRFK